MSSKLFENVFLGVITALALIASMATVDAQDEMMRRGSRMDSAPTHKDGQMDRGHRGGIGTGDAIGIGVGVGGLILHELDKRPAEAQGPKARGANDPRNKTNKRDKNLAKNKNKNEDEIKFVGKPDQIVHDPKHHDGKLGDLNDHKQVVVTKDDSLFTRHYYYRREGKLLTWYWYDEPVSDKSPDIAKLKEAPHCDGENDDDCDRPSGKLPPYVVEIDDVKKKGAATPDKKKPAAHACVVYMQYKDNDKEDPNNTTYGTNGDLAGSANALANGPPLAKLKSVSSKDDLNRVIASFKDDGVCCTKLDIVGHGHTDGSLQLPKDIDGAELDKDSLGGPSIDKVKGEYKLGPNGKYFDAFIASLRVALCPEGKPQVTFDSCWSAEANHSGGSNIAEQVNAEGFATAGYTEKCLFQKYEVTKDNEKPSIDYDPPTPEPSTKYSDSKKKEFPAPEPAKPTSEKADPKAK